MNRPLPLPYEHFQPLATGGMCELFAGSISVDDQETTLVFKRLKDWLQWDDEARLFFRNELHLHQRLPSLSRLPATWELSCDSDDDYLVLEYKMALSMQHLLYIQPRLPFSLCCFWIVQAIEAVTELHAVKTEQGQPLEIVHQDVTPRNLLLDGTGHLTLIDLGLAQYRGMESVWEKDILLGSPRYLPPESFEGANPSQALDWYTLGVSVWEILAGESPFGALPHDVPLASLASRKARPLSDFCPELPEQLSDVLEELLSIRSEGRKEVVQELLSICRVHCLTKEEHSQQMKQAFGTHSKARRLWENPFLTENQ